MSLTVATWNLAGLSSDSAFFADKLDYVGQSLQALDPDVAALLEVQDVAALDALATRLGLDRVDAAPDAEGRRVALLAKPGLVDGMRSIRRWSIPDASLVRELDQSGQLVTLYSIPRPLLEVELKDEGQDVRVIVAHLHAPSRSAPAPQGDAGMLGCAEAELLTLRARVEDLNAEGLNVIVTGDLGDGSPIIRRASPGATRRPLSVQRYTACIESAQQDGPLSTQREEIESPYPLAMARVEGARSSAMFDAGATS